MRAMAKRLDASIEGLPVLVFAPVAEVDAASGAKWKRLDMPPEINR
jgi:hypothetical protein